MRPRVVEGLRLERLVGSGGEGEVWEARDPHGRRRALKLIRPEALAGPDAVAERAAYLTRIDHPALVRVHRSGLLDDEALRGWGFVEMEFVAGRCLADEPGGWELLDQLLPLAEALDLLHAGHWSDGLPLVHRDVKPANLVATRGGRLVLVDPSTLRGVDATLVTRVGTPVFAAPEVMTGRVGPAADVYSFAVTALALVTGARGAELADLVAAVDELDVPEGVRAGLSSQPEDRPVSCRELLTAPAPLLVRDAEASDETWVLGEDPADVPPAPRRRVWPWFVVLAAVVAGPALGWSTGALEGNRLAVAAAAAATVQLGAHTVDRRSVLLAAVLPPVAWAFLLGDRLAFGRRRPWAHALLCGPLTFAWAAPVLAVTGPVTARAPVAALAVAGLALVAAAAAATRAGGGAGVLARLVLLPAWLAGAAVLLAAGVLALPFALVAGSGRAAMRLVVGTLAGAVENFRPPR
ncbi:MAG TPA: serine/threonine-protein kinase [Egibacteraceae bacterium]|nr:serine/threonine-protein kinase [Egibacteraceae bacterium]